VRGRRRGLCAAVRLCRRRLRLDPVFDPAGYTSAYLLVVGLALILLILYFPRGLVGTLRERWLPWLP